MTTARIRGMNSRVDYIFAGGGTGGHLFPGMAVAEELRRRDASVAAEFWGTERELERRIFAEHGWHHRSLTGEPSTNLARHPLRVLRGNFLAYRQAQDWLSECRPAAVIGLGGFSSAPVVYAAHRLGIPIVLLEQNTIPGRATRYLSRWADMVCASFPETATHLRKSCRVEVTGNPISRNIVEIESEKEVVERRHLLILGGSQGASAINRAMMTALPRLTPHLRDWKILHQTGAADVDRVKAAYNEYSIDSQVAAFLSPMSAAYADAGCVVSRAGATTLAELSCCGIPAILVPYPHAVNQHQLRNAEFYREFGAAKIVLQCEDETMFCQSLTDQIVAFLSDGLLRDEMGTAMRRLAFPHAAAAVANLVTKLTEKSR